jgi:hypothetical protein
MLPAFKAWAISSLVVSSSFWCLGEVTGMSVSLTPNDFTIPQLLDMVKVWGDCCHLSFIDYERFHFPQDGPIITTPYLFTNVHNSSRKWYPHGLVAEINEKCPRSVVNRRDGKVFCSYIPYFPPHIETWTIRHFSHCPCLLYLHLSPPLNFINSLREPDLIEILKVSEKIFHYSAEVQARSLPRLFHVLFAREELLKKHETAFLHKNFNDPIFKSGGNGHVLLFTLSENNAVGVNSDLFYYFNSYSRNSFYQLTNDNENDTLCRIGFCSILFPFNRALLTELEISSDKKFVWWVPEELGHSYDGNVLLTPRNVVNLLIQTGKENLDSKLFYIRAIMNQLLFYKLNGTVSVSGMTTGMEELPFFDALWFPEQKELVPRQLRLHTAYFQLPHDSYSFITCATATQRLQILGYFNPFDWGSWLAIGISTLACGTFLWCSLSQAKRSLSAFIRLLETLFLVLVENIPNIPSYLTESRYFRSFLTAWLIIGIILTNGYKSIVTNYMTAPFTNPPRTFEDVRTAGLDLVVTDGEAFGADGMVYQVTHKEVKILRSKFEQDWMNTDPVNFGLRTVEGVRWRKKRGLKISVLHSYMYGMYCSLEMVQLRKEGKDDRYCNRTKKPSKYEEHRKSGLIDWLDKERAKSIHHYMLTHTRSQPIDEALSSIANCKGSVFVADSRVMRHYRERVFGVRSYKTRIKYQVSNR